MINYFKEKLKLFLLKKRFPLSQIYSGVNIDKISSIGKHSVIFRNVQIQSSNIDNFTYIQSNSVISYTNIGKFCSIASNVSIGLAAHPTNFISTNPVFYDNTQPLPYFFCNKKEFEEVFLETNISADVWIGQNAMIKAGVTIGVGAVIGAGAVVTKDVEPYSIVAGVPAKRIKYRFDEKLCKELLDSNWWTLEEDKLKKISKYFDDPRQIVQIIKNNLVCEYDIV